MFNHISPKYDLLNRLLSFGVDVWWRKKAIAKLRPHAPKVILDIATGTGDFAIEALKLKPERIIGADISEGMLQIGREKMKRLGLTDKIQMVTGDSEKLPFRDNFFDAVIVAFGVRNYENLHKGLSDMGRVLKPGGMVCILEFSKPQTFPVKQFYYFYSKYILPLVGKLVSKDNSAYTYLPESVQAFPDGRNFLNAMEQAGFGKAIAYPLTFGIVTIYTGVKPPS